jgi:hypothetical protein
MDNHSKRFFTFIGAMVLLIGGAAAVAQQAKEQPPMKDKIINVVNGDIRPILAIAAKEGSSKGVFVGKVAAEVQQRFGDATVMIKAVRMQEQIEGCPKVVATIYQAEKPSEQQEIPFKVCPK